MMNKKFRTLLKLQRDCNATHNHRTFAMAKTVKAAHLLQQQHFISKCLSNIMDLIISILANNLVLQRCPMAHFIPRDPSAIAYLDSLSHAARGYSTDLHFWWHLQWPDSIQACVAKASTQDTISINILENAAIIINYVATIPGGQSIWLPPMCPRDQQPSGDQRRSCYHHQQRSRGSHLTIP